MSEQPAQVDRSGSRRAMDAAIRVLPGGVNSPVRAYCAVDADPVFAHHGAGAIVTDVDGHAYIDYVGSYGPLILGHAHPVVVEALQRATSLGTSFGMPTQAEVALAEEVVEAVPSIEVVRFVNSGTEAVLSALRVARAVTGRDRIVKCTGCYHGHSDALLVEAGSGATTLGVPSSPGVPAGVTSDTLLMPFNDLGAAARTLAEHPAQVAAVIVEPVAGNMGCIPPQPGFLEGLRRLCDEDGALLIFDEVMTGFRVARGGGQALYGVSPDLTTLGKIVGGGLPCAAYGGRSVLMRQVAPEGPVYQAGTLSGNPLAMAAGKATLDVLADPAVYAGLEEAAGRLGEGLEAAAATAGVPVSVQRVGSMVACFFLGDGQRGPVTNYEEATRCDTAAFSQFFRTMLDGGVLLPPSQYETWFVGTAHDVACIDRTLHAAEKAMTTVAASSCAVAPAVR